MSNYEKMQKLIDNADAMLGKEITNDYADFLAWEMRAKRLLNSLFGQDSIEMRTFLDISFCPLVWPYEASEAETHRAAVQSCHEGLRHAKAIFQSFLDELAEEAPVSANTCPVNYARIFIVHGHDGELKQSVARIIEKQGIEAVILTEQANQGKTIIEKFEHYSDVGGAICLFTADDLGRSKKVEEDRARARQNVVFETGYFIGRLGRDHIAILADDGIEMPSDLSGVVRTNTGNWQVDLLKELKAMGYNVDFNLLF